MYKPNLTKSVPLSNGNPTTAVPVELLSTQVYLPDGNCVTLQEIVKNKESYDGKAISKEQGTSSGGNWKVTEYRQVAICINKRLPEAVWS